jgi:SAM-dependent methyltransferase
MANIYPIQAGFLTYRHAGDPADFVYSRLALHHLPDFWKAVALNCIYGLLRPAGIFRLWDVVYNFDPADAASRIESWCSSGSSNMENENMEDEWSRAELEEHVRDEHSTFTWILEPIVERCGFTVESAEYSDDGISAKYVLRRG